ncbi:MAG TPA: translation initiation factor IF-2 [Candidatus Dormibacteraeota bacterium]|nr:translation initiation factor IF-2 [Candidatus Dormibacteraeota bacterium]
MSRRVHELAKEWGLEPKDLTIRLEKVGLRNKRAQSSLSDEEVQRAAEELGFVEKPQVTIGGERVVVGETGNAVVERRVGTKVIRRRAAATPESEPGLLEPLESIGVQGEVLQAFGAPEPLPEPFEAPPPLPPMPEPLVEEPAPERVHVEEATSAPAAETPAEAPPPPVVARPPAPPPPKPPVRTTVVERTIAPAEPSLDRPFGPKVLGRIDLKKAEAARIAATRTVRPAGAAAPGRGRSPAAAAAEMPPMPPTEERGKKKKRRVIQKPEFAEVGDRDKRFGGARLPRKKRAMPGKEQRQTEITQPKASKRIVRISEVVSVGDLAKAMGVKAGEVVKKLMEQGMMATINQVLDADTATLIASEFGYNVENVTFDAEAAVEVGHEASSEENLLPRPPVVTIMGHVDHGKTSLLDAVRETNVTAGEAGGITQHIGAYTVDVHGRRVTFLDTPGHEAFTAMRARGAKVTDIVILVVAADDGVMPQTIEAINHARAASVPMVVAINKIDKPEANLDRIKQDLANHGLQPEDWGGDTVTVPVSAKTREGLPTLLEMLLLQADLLELKANPDKPARGTIVEAKLDRGRGPVATVLVQEGTLKPGDPFVCGPFAGRVRAMIDNRGHKVTIADPSTPVEILGLPSVPEAGASFVVVADEATARQVAEHRAAKHREASLLKTAKVSLEDLYRQVQAGDTKELRIVIKADVQGSAEALSDALSRQSADEVRLNVLHSSVGGITESDVMLASASNAVVIGFNVRPEAKATAAAEREGVDVRLYEIIYDAINDVRDAMEGLLEPTYKEKVLGRAEVRNTFNIPGIGLIAGCYVTDGKITRNAQARLVRDSIVVHNGKVGSLKRFKDDAREVQTGYECGIGLDNFSDVKVGDIIEAYEMEQVARRLSTPARGAAAERSL